MEGQDNPGQDDRDTRISSRRNKGNLPPLNVSTNDIGVIVVGALFQDCLFLFLWYTLIIMHVYRQYVSIGR